MHYAHIQVRRQIVGIVDVLLARQVRLARIIGHDHDFFLSDAIAAHELIKVDRLLQRHAQRAGLIVFR